MIAVIAAVLFMVAQTYFLVLASSKETDNKGVDAKVLKRMTAAWMFAGANGFVMATAIFINALP